MAIATDQILSGLGTKVFVCGTLPADNKLTSWQALDNGSNFIPVKRVATAGDVGATYSEVNFTDLEDGIELAAKGSYNPGSAALEYAYIGTDPGQEILREYGDSEEHGRDQVAVKYVLQNQTIIYFTALVMGVPIGVGDANSVVQTSTTLRLTNRAVVVKPTVDTPTPLPPEVGDE